MILPNLLILKLKVVLNLLKNDEDGRHFNVSWITPTPFVVVATSDIQPIREERSSLTGAEKAAKRADNPNLLP